MNLLEEIIKAIVKAGAERGVKYVCEEPWPRWKSDFANDPWGASQRHLANAFFVCCAIVLSLKSFELWNSSQPLLLPLLGMAALGLYAFVVRAYFLVFPLHISRLQ